MVVQRILKSNKRIIVDFAYNFVASMLSTGITHLFLYPWLSTRLGADQYGVILTIMGVVNTTAGSVGSSLNSARLLMEAEYSENEKRGDFLPLLFIGNVLGMIATMVYLMVQGDSTISTCICVSSVLFALSFRSYASVYYRINLDFKKILLLNLWVAVGNIIGLAFIWLFKLYQLWFMVFLTGEIFGAVHILLYSDIRKDVFKFTDHLKKIISIESALFVTTLIANLLMYLDRLLLLPVLGGEAVSTYTVASFLGKSFGTILMPLSGVLLSYYAKRDYVMDLKKFWKINASMLAVSIPFFGACALLARPVTGLFYPTLISSATPYLLVANAVAIVSTAGTMTQPAVLKYSNVNWQIVIQALYAAVYLIGGYFGASLSGLRGFTFAALIAAIVRLLMLYVIGHFSIKRRAET